MTGKPAFQAKDYEELLEENARGNVRTRGRRWLALSLDGKCAEIKGLTDLIYSEEFDKRIDRDRSSRPNKFRRSFKS